MNKVSKSIKKFRTAGGLTQNELAERLFVTRQTVSSWENGRTQPDIETLLQLSEALSVSVEELIYGEKPKTVDDGKNEKMRKTMITVFSVIASLLVGVGAILVFVNYWSEFPHTVKTVFSVLPMLIGQAAAVWVYKKKFEKPEWREGAAVLWCAGIAATVALCDSVLELSTDFSACALIDLALFLPIIYIFDVVSPLIVCYALSIYCGVLFNDEIHLEAYGSPAFEMYILAVFAAVFAAVFLGAVYVYIHRKESEDYRHKYSVWITVLAFIALGVFVGIYCEEQVFIPLLSLLILMYALKGYMKFSVPVKTAVPLGIAVASVFLSIALAPAEYEYPDSYGRLETSRLIIIIVSAAVTAAALIIGLKKQKGNVWENIYLLSITALFAFSAVSIRTSLEGKLYTYLAVFVLIIVQAIALIVSGAREGRFVELNIGLLTVIAMIYEVLFSQDINILAVGIVMIFFGVCLFIINYRIARSVNKKSGEAEKSE